ncbi:hypothetical protein JHW43_005050 [Diplocarpon mali]|nr:hypothetical protein JHW43_005050 [Diplocarpon mali]
MNGPNIKAGDVLPAQVARDDVELERLQFLACNIRGRQPSSLRLAAHFILLLIIMTPIFVVAARHQARLQRPGQSITLFGPVNPQRYVDYSKIIAQLAQSWPA